MGLEPYFSCNFYIFQKVYFVCQMLWGSCIVLKINLRQPSIVFSLHNIQRRDDQLSQGFFYLKKINLVIQ